jgi:hypothetical protein
MLKVSNDQEILREAEEVLYKHLGPSKATRFWISVAKGSGDYLKLKEELFQGETVDTLYESIKTRRKRRTST